MRQLWELSKQIARLLYPIQRALGLYRINISFSIAIVILPSCVCTQVQLQDDCCKLVWIFYRNLLAIIWETRRISFFTTTQYCALDHRQLPTWPLVGLVEQSNPVCRALYSCAMPCELYFHGSNRGILLFNHTVLLYTVNILWWNAISNNTATSNSSLIIPVCRPWNVSTKFVFSCLG